MDNQLRVLEELIAVTESAGIPVWFMGGYQSFDPSKTPRPKDVADIRLLRKRIPKDVREDLAALFDALPGTRTRFPA